MKQLKEFFNNKPKAEYVKEMFENLAVDYDLMNYVISFGMHKFVKKQAVKNVPVKSAEKILDVCCGTGDISIFAAERFGSSAEITGVDFSENMLEIAEKKAHKYTNIKFMNADAMNLPFEDETFDVVFISFGLRNLSDFNKAILELKRVTKKDGFVINLDFGKPKSIPGQIFRLYFFGIVPMLGSIIHGNSVPFSYLPHSCEEFPDQERLVEIFQGMGFSEVKNFDFAFGAIAEQIAKA